MSRSGKVERGNIQTISVAAFVLLLALAVVLIVATDLKITTALAITVAAFGVFVLVISFMLAKDDSYGVSDSSRARASGMVLILLGIVGAMVTYGGIDGWIIAIFALIMITILILSMGLRFGGK
jgi:hypothetical protein